MKPENLVQGREYRHASGKILTFEKSMYVLLKTGGERGTRYYFTPAGLIGLVHSWELTRQEVEGQIHSR